jgi:hypothetical protein
MFTGTEKGFSIQRCALAHTKPLHAVRLRPHRPYPHAKTLYFNIIHIEQRGGTGQASIPLGAPRFSTWLFTVENPLRPRPQKVKQHEKLQKHKQKQGITIFLFSFFP